VLIAWAIDNPVRSGKQFPQVFLRVFRNPATTSGNGFQLNRSIYQTPDQVIGILGRIPGNVCVNGGELRPGLSRLVVRQPNNCGFSWSVSVQGKARLAVNGRSPLQEPERRHGR